MVSLLLLALMSIRTVGQIFAGIYYFVTTGGVEYLVSFGLFAVLYLMALIGIIQEKRWGFWIAGGLTALDLAWIPFVATSVGDLFGAVVDVIILYLIYTNYPKED